MNNVAAVSDALAVFFSVKISNKAKKPKKKASVMPKSSQSLERE